MKQNISPELLKAYVFCQSETEAIQLLEEHPELDEYAIPMVAVMEALNRLLQVESIVSEDRGEAVVELYDLPAEGVSRAMEQGAAAGISRWIPVVLSVGRTIPLFLTEKAWALLGILAEGIEDPDLREKSSRYHAALRNCLDEGFDEGWARRERDDGLGDDEESQTMLREFGELRDLLLARSPAEVDELIGRRPWMRPYAEGMGREFTPEEMAIRGGLAAYLWAGSWAQAWRAVRSQPSLLTQQTWSLLERFAKIGDEHRGMRKVHDLVAGRFPGYAETLRECQAEGIDSIFLRDIDLWVA